MFSRDVSLTHEHEGQGRLEGVRLELKLKLIERLGLDRLVRLG